MSHWNVRCLCVPSALKTDYTSWAHSKCSYSPIAMHPFQLSSLIFFFSFYFCMCVSFLVVAHLYPNELWKAKMRNAFSSVSFMLQPVSYCLVLKYEYLCSLKSSCTMCNNSENCVLWHSFGGLRKFYIFGKHEIRFNHRPMTAFLYFKSRQTSCS